MTLTSSLGSCCLGGLVGCSFCLRREFGLRIVNTLEQVISLLYRKLNKEMEQLASVQVLICTRVDMLPLESMMRYFYIQLRLLNLCIFHIAVT